MRPLAIALAALLLAAGANAGERPDYAGHAGAPVSSFRYVELYNWQRLDDRRLVLWTRPGTAYLLTLRDSCSGLIGTQTIALGDVAGLDREIRAGSDYVLTRDMRCRIEEIRPIDLKGLKRKN
jgi:hypothetical protein